MSSLTVYTVKLLLFVTVFPSVCSEGTRLLSPSSHLLSEVNIDITEERIRPLHLSHKEYNKRYKTRYKLQKELFLKISYRTLSCPVKQVCDGLYFFIDTFRFFRSVFVKGLTCRDLMYTDKGRSHSEVTLQH